MTGRRWWRRLAIAVAGFGVLEVVLVAMEFEPDALRLALVVGLVVACAGLLLDSLGDTSPAWGVEARQAPTRGQDPRTARHLSVLESHVTARTPDAALRDRLGALADLVLRQRHGLGRDDPAAPALLGPELSGILSGPARRLSRAEIERCVTRIEEL